MIWFDLSSGVDGLPDSSARPDLPPPPNKIVFVSSQLYDGVFGGLAGADSDCQQLADAAGRWSPRIGTT
jgi:hypothetical protein